MNLWDRTFDRFDQFNKDHYLPVTLGAYSWFHVNHGGPNQNGYGIPGLQGTYFYYMDADPEISVDNRFVHKIGVHAEFRFRDTQDKFRSYFSNTYWFYELYGCADTDIGRFKLGKIWKRFGVDWDDTWWGNVQYFDGFKLNPDYGVSWEQTWKVSKKFTVDSFVQYFVAQDGVAGAEPDSMPETTTGSAEHNTGVVRVVPTLKLSNNSALALGMSASIGQIYNQARNGPDQTPKAYALDLTYTYDHLKLFGEGLQEFGVLNPDFYVSRGPSDRISDFLLGAEYKYGPATFRVAYSAGYEANPSGHQSLWVPGVTLGLTKNVDLLLEYVRWDVYNKLRVHSVYEDGFQIVFNWRL